MNLFTNPSGPVLVPRLNIPALSDDLCDFLRVTVAEVLSPDELSELKALLETSDEMVRSHATRFSPKDSVPRAMLRETLLLHDVERGAAAEEAEAMQETDPSYPSADEIAAHLHIDFILEIAEDSDGTPDRDSVTIDRTLDWLRTKRPELEVAIAAGRRFSTEEFEPLIPFPAAPRPFTAVRGVSLVREADEPSPGSRVYEVDVHDWGEFLACSVSFRGKLLSNADALEKLLLSASEIAAFGVRKTLSSTD